MTHSEAGKIGGKITAIKTRKKSLHDYYLNPNRCLHCNKIIDMKEGYHPSYTRERKYCNHNCAGMAHNRLRTEKYCIVCGNKNVKGLKYCSRECHYKMKYEIYIEKWKTGEIIGTKKDKSKPSKYVRKYFFMKNNNGCQKCGWNVLNPFTNKCHLELHHIDGNSENNVETNLELLCPNCHSLTPNYKNVTGKTISKRLYRRRHIEP